MYVPENFEATLKEFGEICEREGEPMAEKVRDFILKYVDRHRHGNPQTLIETFDKNGWKHKDRIKGRFIKCDDGSMAELQEDGSYR